MNQTWKGLESRAKRLDLFLRKMGSYCRVLYSSYTVAKREMGVVGVDTNRNVDLLEEMGYFALSVSAMKHK